MASLPSPSSPLPFFTPATPVPRPSTSIGLSRWNNANAQPFLISLRRQHQIESDLRLQRRLDCATTLLSDDATPPNPSPPRFRSKGRPSTTPSLPSIPSKVSKYSKLSPNYDFSHPAFRPSRAHPPAQPDPDPSAVLSEDGVSYKLDNAPFEFRYSYTETPKARPIALREPPYAPFGPKTMPRPWTGRAPLPKSRRKLPEFDSFRPPPPGKKGVKPVQAPGPFLAGSGPRHAMTRDEVMGDPLTEVEVAEMVKGCMKTTRQLNMGRDGLTHNMLDNIHAHWKRRRVCKIKCKGVCTVDMDNVRRQLEEKTGGSVIYIRGGVIFLFRGRNYNYKTRPRFPLMLWKPVPPVYPRLVQRAPEGLTLEEAAEMRKRGRMLPPICKLAKNGVHVKLAKDVKEAFELCELVRIDCKGLNKSDTRKIGAKLKDLVPCVLISFEYEYILMWRGKDWKSSFAPKNLPTTSQHRVTDVSPSSLNSTDSLGGCHRILEELDKMIDSEITVHENGSCSEIDDDHIISDDEGSGDEFSDQLENKPFTSNDVNDDAVKLIDRCRFEAGDSIDGRLLIDNACNLIKYKSRANEDGCSEVMMEVELSDLGRKQNSLSQYSSISISWGNDNITPASSSKFDLGSGNIETVPTVDCGQTGKNQSNHHMDGIMHLLKRAVESGCAVLLNDVAIDANIVYERAVSLAKIAPPGPVFKHESKESNKRKTAYRRSLKNGNQDEAVHPASDAIVKRSSGKGAMINRKTDLGNSVPDVVPHGSLRVDELAKLLA